MSHQKFYLQQNFDLINRLEKAYDTLPTKRQPILTDDAFNRLCLMKTKAIALNRAQYKQTIGLEKSLYKIREAALRNIDEN